MPSRARSPRRPPEPGLSRPGVSGEVMLQFYMPELVERTSLAKNAATVRVVEECH